MEGIKVGVGVDGNGNGDEMADGMQFCTNHPYKNNNTNNNNPGGICAFCLQEKLGKLVSSSFPLPLRASPSSSSSSPSFRSDASSKVAAGGRKGDDGKEDQTRRGGMPFLLAKQKKNHDHGHGHGIVFNRSRSTVAPRGSKFRDGFWSFLYLSSKKQDCKVDSDDGDRNGTNTTVATAAKVSRSRSVGCGSRSFSGDFFERISTGFGDCTLRRVESQREGKPKVSSSSSCSSSMKERVKCGGIFGGFMIMTSSSSSSSSSSYWVSSATEDQTTAGHGGLVHGRSKSWGWAFASPMRAFTKPSSNKNKNRTPNLSAIPSLLAVTN
ncbi:hypothetical protein like AT3G06868 [Hibiscus trionum]|uniref:Uncharacterized protein n=1 Tax=Hibiscus trionum TaxID=183268 RepID=A0A9W7HA81_HIBTR|nr:hypothetical protein like AT3G06868 [Hibiscus trionum]